MAAAESTARTVASYHTLVVYADVQPPPLYLERKSPASSARRSVKSVCVPYEHFRLPPLSVASSFRFIAMRTEMKYPRSK